jgi:hypothetical protein
VKTNMTMYARHRPTPAIAASAGRIVNSSAVRSRRGRDRMPITASAGPDRGRSTDHHQESERGDAHSPPRSQCAAQASVKSVIDVPQMRATACDSRLPLRLDPELSCWKCRVPRGGHRVVDASAVTGSGLEHMHSSAALRALTARESSRGA